MRPFVRAELVNDCCGDPGLYVDFLFHRRALLFDLGDLHRLPPRKLLRVSHAFVSHTHMDHFVGFDQLLRVLLAREKRLELFGPPGFIERVQSKLSAYSWNLVEHFPAALTITASEFYPDGRVEKATFDCRERFHMVPGDREIVSDGVLVQEPAFRVRAALLEHDIPCLAFALEEARHVNVLKDRLEARGLRVGPWLTDLKDAVLRDDPPETQIRAQCEKGSARQDALLTLGELRADVLRIVPGQKIAYVTDAANNRKNHDRIVRLAHGADLLFIEAVFMDEDAGLAREKRHLTAGQAGRIARDAAAKELTVFHFSPRYQGREAALRREAEGAFRS
ncbi:MAG: MBL fold metallo-hydrolase [Alphaproteobacteria bacterium]|nr:MBL fold metallo-hydrolase [Alphaproteobacteria bacterium]